MFEKSNTTQPIREIGKQTGDLLNKLPHEKQQPFLTGEKPLDRAVIREEIKKLKPVVNATNKARAQLNEKQQKQFDKALKIANDELNRSYWDHIKAEVTKQMANERAVIEEKRQEYIKEMLFYENRKNVQQLISKEEYKTILGCLHPDRVVNAEKLNKAFIIFKKLSPLFP